jgi:tryptophan synthase alpha chain
MNRIDQKFSELKTQGRKAFIAYLTAGFPDLETNLKLVLEMEKRGVDIVELGVPFSDPIADGPTIQASSQAALKRGTTFNDVLQLAAKVRQSSEIPLVLMGYLNPFLSRPPRKLAEGLAQTGIDGVIIPDLPPEEADPIRIPLKKQGIHTIFLLAPTSPPERIKLAAAKSGGFIYYVSRTGVTGGKASISRELKKQVGQIKRESDLPVCVGFGISTRRQLLEVWKTADGAIVGSALIKPFLRKATTRSGLESSLEKLDHLLVFQNKID